MGGGKEEEKGVRVGREEGEGVRVGRRGGGGGREEEEGVRVGRRGMGVGVGRRGRWGTVIVTCHTHIYMYMHW